ncbi:MAG: hypothetical protein HC844_01500 [Tabrizicola sp.]|nr:hypothetical protein [Tabrizicola sp.]
MLAHSLNGLQFATEDKKVEAESQDAARNFLIDVAFSSLPGPGLDRVTNALFSTSAGAGKDELKSQLNGDDTEIDAEGFDELYFEIRNAIGEGLPEDEALALRNQFGDGFTQIRPVEVSRPGD